jgi:hypothetical protein
MSVISHRRLRTVGEYVLAVLLCMFIVSWVMQLHRTRLDVPFEWGGDALYYSVVVRGMIDHGWFLHNESIGAPWGTDLYDFPMPDAVNFAIIKLLTVFSSNYAVVLNLFFLLTFPLVTVTALYVLRHFGLGYPASLLASLLYTFTPYHFIRNVHHLLQSTYYTVPLVVMVVVWVMSGDLFGKNSKSKPAQPIYRSKRFIAALVICFIASSVGWGYYAFFACFFLLVAGIWRSVQTRKARDFVGASILIAVISFGLFLNLLPNIYYIRHHGNTGMSQRVPAEAEAYGLKIAQLVLPINDHRVHALAGLKAKYNNAPLTNENQASTLGLFATVGFLFLIVWLFVRRRNPDREHAHDSLLNNLSLLNVSAILLATIGGFGSIVALVIFPQIRSYNRISIFIAFFAVTAVAIVLDRVQQSSFGVKAHPALMGVIFTILLAVGVLDQTNPGFIHLYEIGRADFDVGREFVQQIESRLPENAMVFQLPYVRFPEAGDRLGMADYEHFKAYLHSKRLRWSYGSIRGRQGDRWEQNVTGLRTDEMIESLSLAGFSGIYVDRKAYADGGKNIEAELTNALRITPMVSRDNKLAFFDLSQFNETFKHKFTSEQWEKRRELSLDPVIISWGTGCYDVERSQQVEWRWCQRESELHISNNTATVRRLRLSMWLSTGSADFSNLSVSSQLFSDTIKVNGAATEYSRTFEVPPGEYTIRFSCDAPPIDSPTDPRILIFQVKNFRHSEVVDEK